MKFDFSEEELMLRQQVRKFAQEKVGPLMAGHEEVESPEVVAKLTKAIGKQGLCTLFVSKEYGGTGVRSVPICIVREELAKVSPSADGMFAELGLGTFGISVAGTKEQQSKYLPMVAKGKLLATFALTEPDAGSDVSAISTIAKLIDNHYVLNGEKAFASVAGVADFYTIFAKTDPSKGRKGISAFIVERGTQGVEIGPIPMISGPPEYTIKLTNCAIPKENLIGQEGDGWAISLGTLNVFRTTVGAAALGMAEAAFSEAFSYAKQRIAFGQPIANFQAIQFKLADMATRIEASRWLVYHAAYLRDEGKLPRHIKYASMAKLFATETLGYVVDEAVQIHGGWGLTKGFKVEHLFREARLCRIYEGTSEIQRLTIFNEISRGY
jgi:alkylation response protein AidB-like acyl-CoA dehydrogenase